MFKSNVHTAMTVTRSWLRAVKIPFRNAMRSTNLMITGKNGREVEFDISRYADELSSTQAEISIAAFGRITETLGYGALSPVDRGDEPSRKEIYGQDVFLSASRHREFRLAPDLTASQIAEYETQIARECRRFYARNRNLVNSYSYELQDLRTFALIWVHNFVHRFALDQKDFIHTDDNQRLFTRYLRQRFSELLCHMSKERVESFTSFDFVNQSAAVVVHEAEEEEESQKDVYRRRAKARRTLKKHMGTMPHQDLVSRMQSAITNPNIDYAARREARRLLRVHIEECATCLANKPDLPNLRLIGEANAD
jgi:hypothetical protein